MRLAIVATHPIQYQVPWYRDLAHREEIDLTVYYAVLPTDEQQGVGFGVAFAWDVPLLDGYRWKVLPNAAASPSLRGFFASRTPGVRRVLGRDRPDVVVITGWQSLALLQALRACRRLGIPTLMRGESNALRPRPRWARLLHRVLLSRVDAFLAIGEANREFYLRNGVEADRIFRTPYFVDNDWFRRREAELREDREEIRRAWGIGPDSVAFLFVGKLSPKKRVLDFLRAGELARREDARVSLLVVGEGEERGRAERFARERELPVAFTGFLNQTEIGRAYVAADCLVLPSDYGETWGLVVNEGMVHGLPAIVSDRVGCGPDLVVQGETGWVHPFGDPEALAGRMLEAAARPERLRRMGERARARVATHSVERAVEGTLEAARFVLGEVGRKE